MLINRSASRRQHRRQRRRGAAAVEFGLVLVPLTAIVFGCLDFGRFAHTYIAVTNAARAGAGLVTMHQVSLTTWPIAVANTRDAALNELGPDFDPAKVTVQPTLITNEDGSRSLQVDVSYPFQTKVAWPLVPSNVITITRRAEMQFVRR